METSRADRADLADRAAAAGIGGMGIGEALTPGRLEMHFQPITSVRRGSVLGLEALVRARDADGASLAPIDLFRAAREQNCLQELDESCQSLALKAFAPLHRAAPQLLLFLNVDAVSLVRQADDEVSFLLGQAQRYGIDPRNIAVEILECRFSDVETLKRAVAGYRRNGFLVALDDIGTGDSNLDRITQVQPDLIKADRSLIQGICDNYYKQEVFKALVQLSERIGGWIVTEGVENRDDALTALRLGGDLLQGFYLGRPEALPESGEAARDALLRNHRTLRETGVAFKQLALETTKRDRAARVERWRTARNVRLALEQAMGALSYGPDWDMLQAERVLRQAITERPLIESVCLLDRHGLQLTDTVLAPGPAERQKSVAYAPPGKGSDHSLKEYFYLLTEVPLPEYETQPYVPLPNTDLCITITLRCKDPYILCLHLLAECGVLPQDTAARRMDMTAPEMPRRHDGR